MKRCTGIIIILLSFPSCNNLYHGLTQLPIIPVGISGSISPSLNVSYTYPANGAMDVETNRQVLVSFSNTIDENCVYDGLVAVKTKNGMNVAGSTQLYEGNLLVFVPENDFESNADYTASLDGDINDLLGNKIKNGYSWKFKTTALRDTEPPGIIGHEPCPGCDYDPDAGIRIRFSEDVAMPYFENISIAKTVSPVIAIQYTVDYIGGEHTLVLRPVNLEDSTGYTVKVSGVKDNSGNVMAGTESFGFTTGILSSKTDRLEDARNLDSGFGTFGDIDGAGPMKRGVVLTDKKGVPLNGYCYSDTNRQAAFLKEVFDGSIKNDCSSLSDNKYFTLLVNGRNVLSDMGYSPYPEVLTHPYIKSPDDGHFGIDLSTGSFSLPKPAFWCRMESLADYLSPTICPSGVTPGISVLPSLICLSVQQVVFNNGIGTTGGNAPIINIILTPYGNSQLDINKITLSVFILQRAGAPADCSILNINIGDVVYSSTVNGLFSCSATHKLTILNSSSAGSTFIEPAIPYPLGKFSHVYIVIDSAGGLIGPDGKSRKSTAKVYINGIERLNVDAKFNNDNKKISFNIITTSSQFGCSEYIDNLKIWHEVVSDGRDAALWEYTNPREDGLHRAYGRRFNYRPQFVKVGYYSN